MDSQHSDDEAGENKGTRDPRLLLGHEPTISRILPQDNHASPGYSVSVPPRFVPDRRVLLTVPLTHPRMRRIEPFMRSPAPLVSHCLPLTRRPASLWHEH
jgi:hypothetical protein